MALPAPLPGRNFTDSDELSYYPCVSSILIQEVFMAETVRRIRPTPTDAYLGNPHKSCCTFQGFNGGPLFPGVKWSEEGPLEIPPATQAVAPGYLPSTVAYCRWFWRVLEPVQGQYDFSMIDRALQACEERGQTLAVRLMAFGSWRQPQVPDWYAQRYPMTAYTAGGGESRIPVHDSPEYLEHWGRLVREFGRRYDGHPLLESIDITYIGPWGEGAGKCSREQCRRFAQLWQEAFPNTTRLVMIEGDQMPAGLATGAGWRCDCFGDLRAQGTPQVPGPLAWNHMYDSYPMEVILGGAQETWKAAPVHLETCWVPMYWYQHGFDIDFILEQGLKYHATYFMPKSTVLPEPWMEKLSAFCRKLGYRYIFRQAILEGPVSLRGRFRFQCWIENVGVAPIYRPYLFALRLRQGDQETILPFSDLDIRAWLPGDAWIDHTLSIPEGFQPGWIELAAGIIDPVTNQARVRFANKEAFSDRWLDLGGFELARGEKP